MLDARSDLIPDYIDWHIEESRLALKLPSGKIIKPTASEVIGAEYKGKLTIGGEIIRRRPSEALPSVRFSRYPLDLVVEILPPSTDLACPATCNYRLLSGSRRINASISLDDDQLFVGHEWYPLSARTPQELTDIFKAIGICVPGILSLRQYLEFRRQDSDLIVFIDEPHPHDGKSDIGPAPVVESLPGLQAKLHSYQLTGLRWLCRIADEGLGCILGDEMGLGKTLQVIALLLRESRQCRIPSLVITPATLLENWRREIVRFAPSLSINIHRGQYRSGFPSMLRNHDIVITSYDTAMRDISILEMIPWNAIVIDEAQAIKTPDAQRTITLKTLPRRTAVAVTGTPVENRLRDLWSLMDFALPGFLGTLAEFEGRYTNNVEGAASLEPLVTPFILRRRVIDVAADLPERIDIPQPVELSAESAIRYDSIRTQILADYGASASLMAITKLRMFCTHPFLVDEGCGDPLLHSTKYARLIEILDEVFSRGEKVLIFTSYHKMTDILITDLSNRYGISCDLIDGRTPVADRQPIVDRFGQRMTTAVLVLNPKAAGTGLNIAAASHVVHYNLEWNPATEDQATARAHRRGQTRPVTVHRLFHPKTVEEVIDQRMRRKRRIAAQAVIGTEGKGEDLVDIMRAMQLSPVMGEENAH